LSYLQSCALRAPPTTELYDFSLHDALPIYLKNVALVTTVSGTDQPCVVILYNVLSDDEFSLELEDREEGKPAITLSAHYDPANLTDPPYEIRYPVVS